MDEKIRKLYQYLSQISDDHLQYMVSDPRVYIQDLTEDQFAEKYGNRETQTELYSGLIQAAPGFFGKTVDQYVKESSPLTGLSDDVNELAAPIYQQKRAELGDLAKSSAPTESSPLLSPALAQRYQAYSAAQKKVTPEAEKIALQEAREEAFLSLGLNPKYVYPEEVLQATQPEEYQRLIEQESVLKESLKRNMNKDGTLDVFGIAYGNPLEKGGDYTPAQILAAESIPGLDPEGLLKAKEYVVADQKIGVERRRKELQAYQTYLERAQPSFVPEEVLEANRVVNAVVEKMDAGEQIPEEEMQGAQKAFEFVNNLPEEQIDKIDGFLSAVQRTSNDINQIDKDYPDLKAVEELNRSIQLAADEKYKSRSIALRSALSLFNAGAEVIPRLVEGLGATYDSVVSTLSSDPRAAAMLPGAEDAQARLLRASQASVQPGTTRDPSKAQRPALERTADFIDIDGNKYTIGFDKNKEVTSVYGEDGYAVDLPPEELNRIANAAEGLEPTLKFNRPSAWNGFVDLSSDLAGTVALASATAGAGLAGSGAIASRAREFIPIMLQYTGRATEEGLRQGLDFEQAAQYGLYTSAVESFTEVAFPLVGKLTGKPAARTVREQLKRLTANPRDLTTMAKSDALKTYGRALLAEPSEEGLAGVLQPLANRAMNNAWGTKLEEGIDFADLGTQMGLAALVTVLPAASGGVRTYKRIMGNQFAQESVYGLVTNWEETQKAVEGLQNVEGTMGLLDQVRNSTLDVLESDEFTEQEKITLVGARYDKLRALENQAKTVGTASEAKVNADVAAAKAVDDALVEELTGQKPVQEEEETVSFTYPTVNAVPEDQKQFVTSVKEPNAEGVGGSVRVEVPRSETEFQEGPVGIADEEIDAIVDAITDTEPVQAEPAEQTAEVVPPEPIPSETIPITTPILEGLKQQVKNNPNITAANKRKLQKSLDEDFNDGRTQPFIREYVAKEFGITLAPVNNEGGIIGFEAPQAVPGVVEDNRPVIWSYNSEADIPAALKKFPQVKGEVGGKTKIFITVPKSKADKILNSLPKEKRPVSTAKKAAPRSSSPPPNITTTPKAPVQRNNPFTLREQAPKSEQVSDSRTETETEQVPQVEAEPPVKREPRQPVANIIATPIVTPRPTPTAPTRRNEPGVTRTVTPAKKVAVGDTVSWSGVDYMVTAVSKAGFKAKSRELYGERIEDATTTSPEFEGVVTYTESKTQPPQAVVKDSVTTPRDKTADITKAMTEVFGLTKGKAQAAAIIIDRMVHEMARRQGVPVEEVYKTLNFRIGTKEMAEILDQRAAEQNVEGKTKGAYLLEDAQHVVYAFTDPNVSTPLHEVAHIFEHYLTDDERAIVIENAGTQGWNHITSEHFARGFERYLAEGVAPTPELKSLFDQFAEWLLSIYNGIVGSFIDINLNNDIRQVYASMLGVGPEAVLPAPVVLSKQSSEDAIRNALMQAGPVNPPVTKETILNKLRAKARRGEIDTTPKALFDSGKTFFEEYGITLQDIRNAMADPVRRSNVDTRRESMWDAVPPVVMGKIRRAGHKLSNYSDTTLRLLGSESMSLPAKLSLVTNYDDVTKQTLSKAQLQEVARVLVPEGLSLQEYRDIADDFIPENLQLIPLEYAEARYQAYIYLSDAFNILGDTEYQVKVAKAKVHWGSIHGAILNSLTRQMTNTMFTEHAIQELIEDRLKKLYEAGPDGVKPIDAILESLGKVAYTESEVKDIVEKMLGSKVGRDVLSRQTAGPQQLRAKGLFQAAGVRITSLGPKLLKQDPTEDLLEDAAVASMAYENNYNRAKDRFAVLTAGILQNPDAKFDQIVNSAKFQTQLKALRKTYAFAELESRKTGLNTKSRLDPISAFMQEMVYVKAGTSVARLRTNFPIDTSKYTANMRDLLKSAQADANTVMGKLQQGEISAEAASRSLNNISNNLQKAFEKEGSTVYAPMFFPDFGTTPQKDDTVRVGADTYKFVIPDGQAGRWENTRTKREATGERKTLIEDIFVGKPLTRDKTDIDYLSLTPQEIRQAYNGYKKRFGFEGPKLRDRLNEVEEFIYDLYDIDVTTRVADRIRYKNRLSTLTPEIIKSLQTAMNSKDNTPLEDKVAQITGLPMADATLVANGLRAEFEGQLADKKRKVLEKYSNNKKTINAALEVIKSGTLNEAEYVVAFGGDYGLDPLNRRQIERFRELTRAYTDARFEGDRRRALADLHEFFETHRDVNWAVRLFEFFVDLAYASMLNGLSTAMAPLLGGIVMGLDAMVLTARFAGKPKVLWHAWGQGLKGWANSLPEAVRIMVSGEAPVSAYDYTTDELPTTGSGRWFHQVAVRHYNDAVTGKGIFADRGKWGIPLRTLYAITMAPVMLFHRSAKTLMIGDAMVRGFSSPFLHVIKHAYRTLELGEDFADFGARATASLGKVNEVEVTVAQEIADRGLTGIRARTYKQFRRPELWREFADPGILFYADKRATAYALMEARVAGKLGAVLNTINFYGTPANFESTGGQVAAAVLTLAKLQFIPFLKVQGNFMNQALSFTPLHIAKLTAKTAFKGIEKYTSWKGVAEKGAWFTDPYTYQESRFQFGRDRIIYDDHALDQEERLIATVRSLLGTAALTYMAMMLFDFDEEEDRDGNIVTVVRPKKDSPLLITGPGLSSYTKTASAYTGWMPNSFMWKDKENDRLVQLFSLERQPIGLALAPLGYLTDRALLFEENQNQYSWLWGQAAWDFGTFSALSASDQFLTGLYDLNELTANLFVMADPRAKSDTESREVQRWGKMFVDRMGRLPALAASGGNLAQQINSYHASRDGEARKRGDNAFEDVLANSMFYSAHYDRPKINQWGSLMPNPARVFADINLLSEYLVNPEELPRTEVEKVVLSIPEIQFGGIYFEPMITDIVSNIPEAKLRDLSDQAGANVATLFDLNRAGDPSFNTPSMWDNVEADVVHSKLDNQRQAIQNLRNEATEQAKVDFLIAEYAKAGVDVPLEEISTKSKTWVRLRDGQTTTTKYDLAKFRKWAASSNQFLEYVDDVPTVVTKNPTYKEEYTGQEFFE